MLRIFILFFCFLFFFDELRYIIEVKYPLFSFEHKSVYVLTIIVPIVMIYLMYSSVIKSEKKRVS